MKLIRSFRLFLDKLSPLKRRVVNVILILCITVVTFLLLFNYVLPWLRGNNQFQSMTTAEIIATLAMVVTIVLASINLIAASMNKRYSSKKQLHLEVIVRGQNAIITSTVENKGSDRITPKTFYLFIDSGIEKKSNGATIYEFPNILVHEGKDFDCSLAKECKAGRVQCLPEKLLTKEFQETYHACYQLKHISSESVNFIDPGESFSEDAIFKLDKGIYRVILIGTSIEADCMCAHKIFVVN